MVDEKPVILIVDDVASNIQQLAQLLKDDYRVKVANSGDRALELADSQPDLILLDVVMPDMDGYEVCERLHGNETTKDIPVIFITGNAESEDEERGFEMGAVDYITKPFHPAIVKARVRTHIKIRQQYNLIQHQALHDQLTGIYNRHYLLDVVEKKMARSRRHGYPLSLIMLDIDHFKSINDQHGHTVGDDVLREIADLLQTLCRTEDVAARMGGEEFVLLLDQCDVHDGQSKAELIRQQIEKLNPAGIRVTSSFGVTEFHIDDLKFDSFFNRADKALYQAKESGRNQVVIDFIELKGVIARR